MSPIQNVAVLGASGTVGKVVVPALLANGFIVTAITRPGTSYSSPEGVTVKTADYDDLPTLITILQGHHGLVEAFNPAAAKYQPTIVRAALAAGISHLITPEFGGETFNPNIKELELLKSKLTAQRELEALISKSDGKLSWTAVIPGVWYDWAINTGIFWVDKKKKTITKFGSGTQRVSMGRIENCGRAVVDILKDPATFRNRAAYFPTCTFSTNDLIEMISEVVPGKWEVLEQPLNHLIKEGQELWDEDTRKGVTTRLGTQAYIKLGVASLFQEDNRYGADFGGKAELGYEDDKDAVKADLRRLLMP